MWDYNFAKTENKDKKAHQGGYKNNGRTFLFLYNADNSGKKSGYAGNSRNKYRKSKHGIAEERITAPLS